MSVTWERRTLHVRLSLARLLEIGYWAVALALGAVQAWVFRYQPSTVDAVSYLDIGDAYAQGRWGEALNGCWNPLYSWVLGGVLAVVQPTPRLEYPTARAVDYAIYVGALICFHWFLRNFLASYRRSLEREGGTSLAIPEIVWIGIGYTIFLWSSLKWIKVTSSTPDMAGAALTYLAWGLMYRVRERPRTITYALLGMVLALGYYTRTPMLVVGVLVLLLAAVQRSPVERRGAATAALMLAGLTVPFVVSLSIAHGHLTIGDNGKLNHAWLANPGSYIIPDTNWQGGPPGYGAPRHPTRLIWNDPAAFEFASPIGGTYPPWTDPSYWYEGLTIPFSGAAEWRTLVDNMRFYWVVFGRWLLLGMAMALLIAGNLKATLRAVGLNARFWVPLVVGLGLHALASNLFVQWLPAQPLSRYVGVFGSLMCLVAVSCLRLRPRPIWASRAALVPVNALLIAAGGGIVGLLAAEHITELRGGMELHLTGREARLYAPWPPWDVAERLQRTGVVSPGIRVAIVGEKSRHEYWARLIRAQIVAQVPDDDEFWRRSKEEQGLILQVLARAGADVVVSSRIRPKEAASDDWMIADGTNYAARPLSAEVTRDFQRR